MKHIIETKAGKEHEAVQIVFNEFDESSDMSNITVGVYSNGRGFISCKTGSDHGISIPIPFKEGGRWQYIYESEDRS